MSFQMPLTIKEIVDKIENGEYLLPFIARKFIWKTRDIISLFDTLMRGYPIGTFLFWKIPTNNKNEENSYKLNFYKFIKNYVSKSNNEDNQYELGEFENFKEQIAILDGQQRLNSIYIGLKGSYSFINNNRIKNRYLYLNLYKNIYDDDNEYEFEFLSDEQIKNSESKVENNTNKVNTDKKAKDGKKKYWYKVSDILGKRELDIFDYYTEKIKDNEKFNDGEKKFAFNALIRLSEIVNKENVISYYQENTNEIKEIFKIFLRINTEKDNINCSNLIFSFIEQNENVFDNIEEIEELKENISKLSQELKIKKDTILKTCFTLHDFETITLTLDNFVDNNKTSIQIILDNWKNIEQAINSTIILVSEFGFDRDSVDTTDIFIPITHYLFKNNLFNLNDITEENKKFIKKWFYLTLLKGMFNREPNSIIKQIRTIINDTSQGEEFPFDKINNHFWGTKNTLRYSETKIKDYLLNLKYGDKPLLRIMRILYPHMIKIFDYQIDHIYPKSMHKDNENINNICNLQILDGYGNFKKSNVSFIDWIKTVKKDKCEDYKNKNLIPKDADFNDIKDFFEKREKLIFEKLKGELVNE
ncbi:DUF262 domain-containing protein [Metamycoplasma hyosynoviae]|uniref:DUF262 domain-containing protein n=1 Tax=Metamycoplasma hyosynoviae TaxID=29559 RepID=UPI0023585CD8|nr:DUF262 domain-containing protein [Metamycoplasma hyosynoviae]MDC8918922.1 DUF262 domain-containing protein [Metamycoplasma hyosynoviae]